jgi:hypothetical protein
MTTPATGASETSATLRLWLMKAPRPASLKIYATDGREYDVEIQQGAAWSETAISVAALIPERIEALASDGHLLRAVVVADLVKKEELAVTQRQATFSALTSSDPETQRMIAFAELISRAHDRATDAIQETVRVAFTQLQEICGSLAEQANASTSSANELSVAIRNLLIQQAQDAIEQVNAPEPPSPMEQLATNFLSGQNLAKAEAENAPKPNGAKNGVRTNGRANGKHP